MVRYEVMLHNESISPINVIRSASSDVMNAEALAVWLFNLTKRHKSNQSLQGRRTLSLLVENCGRVHQGRDLDKQRKGD